MQEEVEHRTVALVIQSSKLTARELQLAMKKFLEYVKSRENKNEYVKPKGKQTLKELVGQNAGVENLEINDGNVRDFERTARKYGVDFAVKKDRTGDTPRYLVFFKARDRDALLSAFREFSARQDRLNDPDRTSVLELLRKPIKRQIRPKLKNRDKGLEL